MRLNSVVLFMVATLLISPLALYAQDQPAGNKPANDAATTTTPKPATTKKPHYNNMSPMKGYLKNTKEAQDLWTQQGKLQTELQQKQWDLFVLLNAQPVDAQAVRAKFGEMRGVMKQLRDTHKQLEQYWVPFPEGQGLRQILGSARHGRHHGAQGQAAGNNN